MTFDVSYSNRSKKFLRKADKVIVKRVIEKIKSQGFMIKKCRHNSGRQIYISSKK